MKGPLRPNSAQSKRRRRTEEQMEKAREEAQELSKMIGENAAKAV